MFDYIKGKIEEVTPTFAVLENEGKGYRISISLNTYSTIKEQKFVKLYAYVAIRHESQATSNYAIYGFSGEAERELFFNLISVSGVGNNTALLILSSFGPNDLINMISGKDAGSLQKIKGIGAKTAQRIIVDLQDKLGKVTGAEFPAYEGNTIRSESLSALLTLGFNRKLAEKAVDKVLQKGSSETTVEEVVKVALANQAS